MKDASSTDVVVHAGRDAHVVLAVRRPLPARPRHARDARARRVGRLVPAARGVSAHTKVDERTGELLFFNYATTAPYLHYGVRRPRPASSCTASPVPLPGPRLPHDMAFTEHFVDPQRLPAVLGRGPARAGRARRRGCPTCRRGSRSCPAAAAPDDVRWFEADPTYVLHWTNAYEDGDEIVLDGFFQGDPSPQARRSTTTMWMFRYLALDWMQTRLHRWRINLAHRARAPRSTLRDDFMRVRDDQRPLRRAGPTATRTRRTASRAGSCSTASSSTTSRPARTTRYAFPTACSAARSPWRPRAGATAEDDGYLVTFTTDVANDRSECLVLDAPAHQPTDRSLASALPERISSGTHAAGPRAPRSPPDPRVKVR